MRKRKGLRAQMRDWNYLTREMKREAKASLPRCGCSVNAPEADPEKYDCPCGNHCKECKHLPELS